LEGCVSIQLVSPASGERQPAELAAATASTARFHSISFPSEWGANRDGGGFKPNSICFHSISFPSEWGGRKNKARIYKDGGVSIQLVSPASGEQGLLLCSGEPRSRYLHVSIQLVSPASGECRPILGTVSVGNVGNGVSIQLVSPASGELPPGKDQVNAIFLGFPFN